MDAINLVDSDESVEYVCSYYVYDEGSDTIFECDSDIPKPFLVKEEEEVAA